MPEPAPNTEKLDQHLLEIVQALHGAVKRGILNVKDTEAADRAVRDCKELLDEIMKGNVSEWLH
ncbi:MAG TPA: hypothetical protein VNN77_17370 [candidate division Zixibacteria bacterium]|nr:hypothetical protein [candidate division Zixibacteria bacterium]